MAAIPRMYVNPPTREALPYGLLAQADIQENSGAHWRAGIDWTSICGDPFTALEYCVTGSVAPTGKADPGAGTGAFHRGAQAFTVVTEIDCSAPGGHWERGIADAQGLLRASQSYAVEAAFWSGTAAGITNAVYPRLASNTTTTDGMVTLQTSAVIVTGGLGVTPNIGIGALEAASVACYHSTVTLHVPMIAVSALMDRGIIKADGNSLRTISGNKVIVGSGYSNTSPAGVLAGVGQAWIYATGEVFGFKSPMRTFAREDSFDRSTNTLKVIAEATFVVGFECCHHAVLINL